MDGSVERERDRVRGKHIHQEGFSLSVFSCIPSGFDIDKSIAPNAYESGNYNSFKKKH